MVWGVHGKPGVREYAGTYTGGELTVSGSTYEIWSI
jgi:hypothetical protein